jgi:pilus assembly protein CpaE
MDDVARVLLALETPQLAEEVLHFLDRSGRARVVGTADDGRQLAEAVRQLEPDALVAEPMLAIGGIEGVPLLALSARESVAALRAAVRAGARGFYAWPGDREALLEAVAATGGSRRAALTRRATVIAVHASRGGAGCTFVATHLAQAFARRGASCLLIDLDLAFGDCAYALGATEEALSLADLVPVRDELDREHLDRVAWRGALLAPDVGAVEGVDERVLRVVIETAAASFDVVILHLPRVPDAVGRWALDQADRVVEVLALDVLSFRASSRFLGSEPDGRVDFVVNRAARGEIVPADVARVFGREPLAVIAHDAAAPRAQDHGRLLAPKGRIGRSFARLAAALIEDDAATEDVA